MVLTLPLEYRSRLTDKRALPASLGEERNAMASLPETGSLPGRLLGTLFGRLSPALQARWARHGATVLALGVRVGAAGLAYLLQILLARLLGLANYGTFSFAWNLVTIGGFLATFGFGQIAVRFLAQYHAEGRADLAHGFLRLGTLITVGGSIGFAAIGLGLFPVLAVGYGQLCCQVLAIGVIALPFFALTDFLEGIARSQGWTLRALVPPYIIRQGLVIVLLGSLAAMGMGVSATLAMMVALLGTFVAALCQLTLVVPALLRLFPPTTPRYDLTAWRMAAVPMLLSDLAVLGRQHIDLIILGLLAPPATVGLYFAATRIASLLGLIEFALGAAFGHRFAREAAKADPAQFEALYAETRRLTRLPGLLATMGLVVAAPLVLKLFGPAFTEGALPAQVLIIVAGLRLLVGPAEEALAMAGHPGTVWRAQCAGALLTASLCLVLAGPWQALGAALASAAGGLFTLAWLCLSTRRLLGFWPHAARPARP